MATPGGPPPTPVGRAAGGKTLKVGQFSIPGARGATQRSIQAYRNQLKTAGYRGGDLKTALQGYRQATNQAAQAAAKPYIPENMQGIVGNPRKFLRSQLQGKATPFWKVAQMGAAGDALGYHDEQNKLQAHYGGAMDKIDAGEDPIDLRMSDANQPIFNERQQELLGQLQHGYSTGQWLDPKMEQSMRASGGAQVAGGADEANRMEASRLASAGMDPRSGVAADVAQRINLQRAQGNMGVEHDIAGANQARQQDLENQAAGWGGAEEGQRQYNVGASASRMGTIESGMGGLAGLAERQRQNDFDTMFSKQEAEKERAAKERALKDLEPSTFERVAGGLKGFVGGLSGT